MNLQEKLKFGKRLQPQMEEEQESYFNRIKRQKYMKEEILKGNAYEEALEKERKLVASMKREIEYRDGQIVMLKQRNDQTIAGFLQIVDELTEKINIKAELIEAHVSEIRMLQSQNKELECRLRWKSIALEESKTRKYLECTRLEKEIKELKEKSQNVNATEIDNLESQIAILKSELEKKSEALLSLESRNNIMVLKESSSRQKLKEACNESVALRMELEKQSEALQSLESLNNTMVLKESSSRQKLKEACKESVALRMELEKKSEALRSLESLNNTLVSKELESRQELLAAHNESIALRTDFEENIDYLESLNNALILKELASRRDFQEARSESIASLRDLSTTQPTLVIKRMGEIDGNVFQEACSHKFPNGDWEENSAILCSSWEEYIGDPNWHPFKTVDIKGKLEEIVDEDDLRLKKLRKEYGKAVYKTVTNALMELNEHNPSGRYLVSEVWNPKEGRIATMKEIIQYLVRLVKTLKSKR